MIVSGDSDFTPLVGKLHEHELDEWPWTEDELVDGRCPDSGGPVEWVTERNYFFRMSAWQERLLQLHAVLRALAPGRVLDARAEAREHGERALRLVVQAVAQQAGQGQPGRRRP